MPTPGRAIHDDLSAADLRRLSRREAATDAGWPAEPPHPRVELQASPRRYIFPPARRYTPPAALYRRGFGGLLWDRDYAIAALSWRF